MTNPIPLPEFRDRVIATYLASRKRPRTIARMAQMLSELVTTLGKDATTADLAARLVASFE